MFTSLFIVHLLLTPDLPTPPPVVGPTGVANQTTPKPHISHAPSTMLSTTPYIEPTTDLGKPEHQEAYRHVMGKNLFLAT